MSNKNVLWMGRQKICPVCDGKFIPKRRKQLYDQPFCRKQAFLSRERKKAQQEYEAGLERGLRALDGFEKRLKAVESRLSALETQLAKLPLPEKPPDEDPPPF